MDKSDRFTVKQQNDLEGILIQTCHDFLVLPNSAFVTYDNLCKFFKDYIEFNIE